ncbi:succinate dehydrogenase, cytochrome b556 subunit [Phenylobacterium sp.]|uniref:succinate dehydrogenase, cytochrome b556 subunit n=1 Tax=Phenylobacterium sp. TaxID=1871053 RepID=UPI00272FF36D|nr:succinate dehydrogenase, cytochrome b556 subunit [Phenylobacterium sp.]MDP1597788.1 succinate dehydrogenase, cytochrome b556 subunit [Phenylobacterium sp.]MDP3592096.1 succinate dehydrogenase, cytochrome b556 subunit [Phenylobacterium sp.]
MTDAPRERPLSPHTTIWRWHLTMATSILHRASGCALYGGGLILAIWAMTLAAGPEAYGTFKAVMGSFPGKIVMFGLTLATFYHLAKGIQHLIWDAGHGYNLKTATMGAIATIAFAIAATLAVWIIAAMTGAL